MGFALIAGKFEMIVKKYTKNILTDEGCSNTFDFEFQFQKPISKIMG